MNKEHLKKGVEVQNTPEENNYQRYQELGGIINEKDYNGAIKRSENATTVREILIRQAENIAKFAGIELHSTQDAIDPRIILYGILRSDVGPEEVKYHHDQMSDQQIFVEALRILEDTESVDKMIKAHPNISFKYQRETGG
ncbi:MAG: hypothetical protein Q7K45_07150 [Nanoarchaeota archaeon]|nr:hypothetical protein [Nanoarchaeota archaeon]